MARIPNPGAVKHRPYIFQTHHAADGSAVRPALRLNWILTLLER